MTPDGCDQSRVVVDASGRGHGFTNCRDAVTGAHHLGYVEGSGTTWHTTVTTISSFVVSAADDGTNTYALAFTPGRQVRLVIRSRSGHLSSTLLQHTPNSAWADGSIIAAGGRWWAVWSVPDAACGCSHLWTARTMSTPYGSHNTYLRGIQPSLALRGRSSVLAWLKDGRSAAADGTTGVVAVGYPTATGFTQNVVGVRGALYPVVATVGGSPVLNWQSRLNGAWGVEFRQLTASGWVGRRLGPTVDRSVDPDHALFTDPVPMQVGPHTVSLAWTTRRSSTTTVTVLARRIGSTWTTTLVGDGRPGGHGNRVAALSGSGAHLDLILTHIGTSTTEYYDVRRRL